MITERESEKKRVKAVNLETFSFLLVSMCIFLYLSQKMGVGTMFKVIMYTAHDLLLNTVFFIMAIAVLAGAIANLLSEFGVISLINYMFAFLMKPLYNLPGAAIVGAITTYLSDNPAVISLANDKTFKRYFKDYELPALCNLGTSFGMGLIVTTFMMSQGKEFIKAAIIGNVGAIIGSIISVRLMIYFTKEHFKNTSNTEDTSDYDPEVFKYREIKNEGLFQRVLDSILEGGKTGVEMGLAIIPGVLFICTLVMILTFGPSIDPASGMEVYNGVAYEGVGLLPAIGKRFMFILNPLFGFTSSEAIAFPITSLGAVGAAISLVPKFISDGIAGPNEIAVFTAMGMCWSGYLSTHVGMMDALNCRKLTNNAILSHTIGGIFAGISAHYIHLLLK
ncbi:CD0519/CD1768 family membrane protein [Alkalithermobacter paradoxus]|uniref:Nucleoside recognition n=2 Tax=Alkalithermobacter paradoxus TaxID=29349 RepID=A0A1V4I8T6_9FIRM|nr:nucleoside recognition [[Clostridium] thermoalcaliphilum]